MHTLNDTIDSDHVQSISTWVVREGFLKLLYLNQIEGPETDARGSDSCLE